MFYFSPYDELQIANKYDFVTELTPGVWKICRKEDRIEYLAHDMTENLYTNSSNPTEKMPTDFMRLLYSRKTSIITPLKAILNHGNIVSLVDIFSVQGSTAEGKLSPRHYAVWEYCDAGNLGNLLINGQRTIPKLPNEINEGDWDELDIDELEAEVWDGVLPDDDPTIKWRSPRENMFLPESLCWHVLVSMMKALAWLHEGAIETPPGGPHGRSGFIPYVDWEPILHRNIVPENIFFMHPRRGEWYGACKLGNYCNAFISSHHNGYNGQPDSIQVRSKALAPPRNKESNSQSLEELVELDEQFSHTYPQQDDQPYTKLSEVRALGEIVQAMMVPPGFTGNHVASMKYRRPEENLKDLNYSHTLKNMVVWLMEFSPDVKRPNGDYVLSQRNRHFPTTLLCSSAKRSWETWLMSNDPEARKWGTATLEVQLERQLNEDNAALESNQGHINEMVEVLTKQDGLTELFFGGQEEEEDVDISITASTGGV